jgi:zinc transporter ZupT
VLHGVLEGSILIGGEHAGAAGRSFYAVVLGVALHHVPAAVALATLLRVRLGSFGRVWPWLGLFALASPIGLVFSNYVVLPQLLGGYYAPLLGFVAGTFLHVSTTILFETSPEHHHLNWRKLGATVGGAVLALGISS